MPLWGSAIETNNGRYYSVGANVGGFAGRFQAGELRRGEWAGRRQAAARGLRECVRAIIDRDDRPVQSADPAAGCATAPADGPMRARALGTGQRVRRNSAGLSCWSIHPAPGPASATSPPARRTTSATCASGVVGDHAGHLLAAADDRRPGHRAAAAGLIRAVRSPVSRRASTATAASGRRRPAWKPRILGVRRRRAHASRIPRTG